MEPAESFIRLIDVSKVFYNHGSALVVLKHTRLGFRRGEFVALVGPSGSGKTTLLSLIGGVMRPTKGSIVIDGKEVTSLSEDKWAIFRRSYIGFVFQSHNLIGPLTAYENVEIPMILAGIKRRDRELQVPRVLRLTETYALRDRPAQDLSGGEQQRLAIARAIVMNPLIILADEPTGELDTETGSRIMEALRHISRERNVTVIVATHDQLLVERSDRTLWIRDGWIKADGVHTDIGNFSLPSRN